MKDSNGIEYNLNDFMSYAQGRKIVIFGAGKYGNHVYETLRENDIDIFAICDNNKDKLSSLKDRYPVCALEDLKCTQEEYYFVIAIARIEIVKVIREQLEAYGVPLENLVIPFPESGSIYFDGLIMFDPQYCIQALKEQWMRARQDSRQIADYFETNGLYRLMVFEIDGLEGWLDQDLFYSKVVIKRKIKDLDEFAENEEFDGIVVLDEVNYEMIEEELMHKTEVPVISIWDVVRF